MSKQLHARHAAFLAEFRVDRNATRAYVAVYGKKLGNSAGAAAYRLLQRDDIKAELARLDSEKIQKLAIDEDELLTEALNIALADPRELIEYFVGACRHCFGEGFKYQRTVGEFNKEFEDWTDKKGKDPDSFDHKGGIGFDPRKGPNPECPECAGAGAGRVVLKDTRKLSPRALALYAGVKETQFGIEVKMHSKLDALEKLFKHLGVYAKSEGEENKSPFVQAMREFMANLHEANAGKAPVVPHEKIRRIK